MHKNLLKNMTISQELCYNLGAKVCEIKILRYNNSGK